MAITINGNRVYRWQNLWRVESADGSWDGYELYDTCREALDAAQHDDREDDE